MMVITDVDRFRSGCQVRVCGLSHHPSVHPSPPYSPPPRTSLPLSLPVTGSQYLEREVRLKSPGDPEDLKKELQEIGARSHSKAGCGLELEVLDFAVPGLCSYWDKVRVEARTSIVFRVVTAVVLRFALGTSCSVCRTGSVWCFCCCDERAWVDFL